MKIALEEIFDLAHKAQTASCTCDTKTSLIEYHDEKCHYRQFSEIFKVAQLALQKEIHE